MWVCVEAETGTRCTSRVKDVMYVKLIPGHERHCSCERGMILGHATSQHVSDAQRVLRGPLEAWKEHSVDPWLCIHVYM